MGGYSSTRSTLMMTGRRPSLQEQMATPLCLGSIQSS